MLAERPLPNDLDERLTVLVRRWSVDIDVAAIYLFGSRAQGTAGPRSDVDLAVVVRADMDERQRFSKRMALLDDATRALGTDAVDVVVMDDAPSVLAHRVLRAGRLLAERDPQRRARVVENVMRRYLDERWLHTVLDEGLQRRVREGRFAD